ncbi:hypothetical protein B0J13DRAFT_538594 [Dactylonectria estremocensis]|uniref:NmrA-like domain-containing protein n=1 Tax=Dactylonectria estremocensis TaxID=1079267 RepID=A0A9P9JJ26_9HYPO|nr:hypothetical protein B0J13DRAFT_538594 [Dactylonectria estremocensis]
MSKILAVFGATGQQGGSVVNYVLNDPELSSVYKIRAITRDVNSEKAKAFPGNVEVVQGDLSDRASLESALTGVHTVFAMTTPSFVPNAFEIEVESAKRAADVAVEKGVEYFIFSTLPSISTISSNKYAKSNPFDSKATAEQYIRGLPIKSAFYAPGSFIENFQSYTFLAPRPQADGTYVLARHTSPKMQLPLLDAVGDTGKFIGAILAEPDKFEGKILHAAKALYNWEEIVAIMSKSSGKTVVFKQVSPEEFGATLPPPMANVFVEYFSYLDDFGYYGPETKELIARDAKHARGKLTTYEEYVEAHPFQLE